MFSAFRGIWLVAEQRSRGALRDAGLHFAAALRLSGRGKSPGLQVDLSKHSKRHPPDGTQEVRSHKDLPSLLEIPMAVTRAAQDAR